jgi:formamidopyrimidine-DNA glycosylase
LSVEVSEALILAGQMDRELRGKRVKSYRLQDYKRLQKVGFLNKDIRAFDRLVDGEVESVTSRGNVIRIKLDNAANLILAPEYGGRVTYLRDKKTVPNKLHLRVDFSDGAALAVRLTGMGVIQVFRDDELERSYVYRRDFLSGKPSLTDDEGFTFNCFRALLADRKDMMKLLLVGKDAVVVGLGNSAYQDMIFRARIHPKKKASELSKTEMRALYDAIRSVVRERIKLGGKDQFTDFYGKPGRYVPAMGSHVKSCVTCGTPIEKLSIGGGQTYFCPKCQSSK